jgi:hypothetical protein
MKRILGMGVGVLYLGLAAGAFMRASRGYADGHVDYGFWWMVVTALLGIAGLGALVGTWIHTQGGPRPVDS